MTTVNESNDDFAAMLAEFEPAKRSARPRVGQMTKGTIINIGSSSIFLDLGGKSEGVLNREEVTNDDGELTVALGDTLEARVVEMDGPAGCIVLQRSIGKGADAANALIGAYEAGMAVEGMVDGLNKGGLEVTVAGLRAFCPISQIDTRFVEDANHFIGQKHNFKITKIEQGRGSNLNIVLSRRKLLEEENAVQAAVLRETLSEGMVLKGRVSSLKEYGAFIDLGGLEGMLHISEIGHSRIGHPNEVLSVDQQMDVKIISIKPAVGGKDERISLSIKALHDSPWETVSDTIKTGQQVTGTVVRLQPFGAFIELAPGLEGLAHISEIGGGKRINHPREVLTEGESIKVTILAIDPIQKRVSLTLLSPDEIPDVGADRKAVEQFNAASSKGLGTFADLLKNVKA